MRRSILKTIVSIFAVGLIFIAIFAIQLGIDNDPGWGRGRYLLFGLGLLMLGWVGWDRIEPGVTTFLTALLNSIKRRKPSHLTNSFQPSWLTQVRSFWGSLAQSRTLVYFSQHRIVIAIVMTSIITILLYLWIFTAGTMTEWPNESQYFHKLGIAFSNRQLHLLEQPGPELLAVENPYFHKDRGRIPVLWDALFFEGKYYLYWGPIPGLIVTVLQPFFSKIIQDSALVMGFMLGLMVFCILLLRAIWQRFEWLSRRMFVGALMALTLNAPLVWLLTRPKVYEAAIVGGQFFLFGGLFWAFTGLRRSPISKWRLILAGVFWGLAANTRVNLAFVIAFVGLLVILQIFILNKWAWWPSVRVSLLFGIPLLIGAGGLMWYNYARFGSPLDFGYHFLITGPTIPKDPSNTSSLGYIIPNFYQYLLRPPEIRGEFPYVIVPWIKNDMWPALIKLPRDYFYTEPVASLLLTVPVVGLAVLAALRLVWLYLNGFAPPRLSISTSDRVLWRWLMLALSGSVVFALIVLLVFIQNSYRYIVDITPSAILLGILFLAKFQQRLSGRLVEGWIWRMSWRAAVLLTPVFGVLIAIKGYARAFENQNPDLFYKLLNWFP